MRWTVLLIVVSMLTGGLAVLQPWQIAGEPASTADEPVARIVLPEGVDTVGLPRRPPVVPAPDADFAEVLAEAAQVDWNIPEERRDLNDGVPSLPGSDQRPVVIEGCRNRLVQLLARAGFTGEDLREAWAIAMRETGGRAEVGLGHPDFNGADFGLFQFNKPTFAGEPWWDDTALLDGDYNARVAYHLSRGGGTWYLWGLDGQGRTNPVVYASIWTSEQIDNWITRPYQKFYAMFPC